MTAAAATEDRLLLALANASDIGNTAEVSRLLDAGAPYGKAPLIRASKNGHVGIVRMLLDRGASVDATDDYRTTALLWATKHGYVDIVRMLLDRGASVDATDDHGRTALMWASCCGRVEIVRMLLDRGASVDATDINGVNAVTISSCRECQTLLRGAERLPRWHRRHSLATWGHAANKLRG
ncbi:hypothetical protein FNF28_02911 [Cafeteria roenbergensis]|uniref:Uncharacterized protein n=1 Tax=Cafeteria roenbergensis TaxID=33653 RepID=A0A5A8DQS9_CAFRO|nr:hypothetical protein FNF28_02911 [Cafeteria roenbergensis]